MPRAKIETAFLGHYTLAILDECDYPDAGVLIRTLSAWILRDELADEADLPAHLRVLWRIIRDESNAIHAAREQLRENGKAGGRPTKPKGNQKETKQEPKGNQKESKIEIEVEREISPASAGDARAREAFAPCVDCPAPEANVRATARHIGMPDAELQSWRDYWTMREWRADPRSARPMTPAGVLASLRRWHAEEGIRAAKQAHLDAKADERALAVAAARDERRTPAAPDDEYELARRNEERARAASINVDEILKFAKG